MNADATENHFKLFKLMHKVKCLEKRAIYVSRSFEVISTHDLFMPLDSKKNKYIES